MSTLDLSSFCGSDVQNASPERIFYVYQFIGGKPTGDVIATANVVAAVTDDVFFRFTKWNGILYKFDTGELEIQYSDTMGVNLKYSLYRESSTEENSNDGDTNTITKTTEKTFDYAYGPYAISSTSNSSILQTLADINGSVTNFRIFPTTYNKSKDTNFTNNCTVFGFQYKLLEKIYWSDFILVLRR